MIRLNAINVDNYQEVTTADGKSLGYIFKGDYFLIPVPVRQRLVFKPVNEKITGDLKELKYSWTEVAEVNIETLK